MLSNGWEAVCGGPTERIYLVLGAVLQGRLCPRCEAQGNSVREVSFAGQPAGTKCCHCGHYNPQGEAE